MCRISESNAKKCENCKYHDDFTWVCTNSRSPYCADFTNEGCRYKELLHTEDSQSQKNLPDKGE